MKTKASPSLHSLKSYTKLDENEFHIHNPLDDLDDQQLVDSINELETERRHLQLENIIFSDFLKKNDPILIEGIDPILIKTKKDSLIPTDEDIIKRQSHVRFGSSRLSITDGSKGPRINLTQKSDLILRAVEETQTNLEEYTKKSHRSRCNLKAELEEIGIRESEIKEAIEIFENSVVIQGLDKLTQRIPAEKFIRFMQEWLKSAQFSIEKVRLRTTTTKNQYVKICNQLTQREELGENIRAVDFEKLRIENRYFLKTIDRKNNHLLELKQMTGSANLVLTTHKKQLQKQLEELQNLEKAVTAKERKTQDVDKECQGVEMEIKKAKEKFKSLNYMKESYRVPDVMEYINSKSKLHDLKKNIKVRNRRRNVQNIALNACITEMKNVTGSSTVKQSWFNFVEMSNDSEEENSVDVITSK